MRFVMKDEAIKRAFLGELREKGIKYEIREELGYETFIGYVIEGTFEEIRAIIETLGDEEKDVILQGFQTFKEQFLHVLEHLKEGEHIEALLREGYWVGDVIDQLMRNGAVDIDREGNIKLKEDVDVTKLKLQFKIPYELIEIPESIEEIAKQYALVDLLPQYIVEIKEVELEKINLALNIAARYFSERQVLSAYFALLSKALLSKEIVSALGQHDKIPKDILIRSFLESSPVEIASEKGLLVINLANQKAMEAILRELEKEGYIDIKANKVKKLKSL
ncbi:hypothetical protein PAP_06320 [Palaeococcus pacificus DY20341]|uniref:Uncharacterized protein n=1 Tax=Palaeococcus pacificus DY20341 TaxID=1343739 RepID=A0A075LU52_9EURY|nr:hypothetical protein [Palaeococcus pacificus]AIF69661.1 hypothetical protein PAP_06320 [Palaeococcus pacificus DY20341]